MLELKNIKIVTLNSNSIVNHASRIELEKLIRRNKPDLLLVQETRLSIRHRIAIQGYNIYRTDKTDGTNGTAIISKTKLKTAKVEIGNLSRIECTAIEISKVDLGKILVISVYIPCATNFSQLNRDLNTLNDKATGYDSCIIGGDFNARNKDWDSVDNITGCALKNWLQSSNNFTHIIPTQPTFPRSNSFLDHFLISSSLVSHIWQNFTVKNKTSFSDHMAIELTIKPREVIQFLTTVPPTFNNYKDTDWNYFQHTANLKLSRHHITENRNLSKNEIDNYIDIISSAINETCSLCIKTLSPALNKYSNLPRCLENLFKERHKLKKSLVRENFKTFRDYQKIQRLRSQINCLTTLINQNMNIHLNTQFKTKIENIKPGPNMFKEINRLTGRNRLVIPDKIKIGQTYSDNPEEIATTFANYYQKLYDEISPAGDPLIINATNEAMVDIENSDISHITVFSQENPASSPSTEGFTDCASITNIIREINPKKSSGPDGISNFIIKKLPFTYQRAITIIINNCLNNSYFPNKWKEATIFPIPKTKKAETPCDHRPISMTNNLGKILEKVIQSRLNSHIYREPAHIPENQFGFKAGHSTVDALTYFTDTTSEHLNKRKVVVACLLDLEKAFDSVWIKGLIFKLKQINLNPNLIRLIYSFLRDRKATVKIKDSTSSTFTIGRGVPQGTVLGPTLFNIFTHDQPLNQTTGTETILFADDTIVFSTSPCPIIGAKRVEEQINNLVKYHNDWGININANKSKLIVFRPPSGRCSKATTRKSKTVQIKIKGQTVKTTDNVKYLGINLTNKLKFNPHIDITIDKARRALGVLQPIIRQLHLNISIKQTLYKQLIRPILCYGFPVWATASPTYLAKLGTFERKIIRSITGKHRKMVYGSMRHYSKQELYSGTKIEEMDEHLEVMLEKYLIRNKNHKNKLKVKSNEDNDPTRHYYLKIKDFERIVIKNFLKTRNDEHRG